MSVKKKIVHEMTVDDLITLATGSDEEIVMDKISDAAKFIYELGIKHGLSKIPAQIIYYTYKHWKGIPNKQSKPVFFRDFSKYFERHRNTDGIYYLLDPKPFDLTDETRWIMRAEDRRERLRRIRK